MRIGILGAGLSGVLMGMQLRSAGFDDLVLYERQPDVGGTWLRNTYPGLHCDIPSHLYSYTQEPNPDWSMRYAGGAEIQAYVRRCAEKHGLLERTRFDTTVEVARWLEDGACWDLELAGPAGGTGEPAGPAGVTPAEPEHVRHDVLVAATGGLTEPNLPRIAGLDAFAGTWWHSGAWRHDVPLEGRRVAVVGSAASAVQVVPEVAKRAASVVVFSRTPNWVLPRANAPYAEDERRVLREDPAAQRRLWRRQYRESMLWHGAFTRSERSLAELRRRCLANLRAAIDDPATVELLTPTYDPGCKRILVSDDYYATLAAPHVQLVAQGVTALTDHAVVAADGSEHPADVVVFCTGYKLGGRADGRPAVDVRGRDGLTMRDAHAGRPRAYRGVAIAGFPNHFTVCGINGSVAYGPQILSAELATAYITRLVQRMVDEGLRTMEVRPEVVDAYDESIQAELQTMSWAGDCPNFYRDRNGRIVSFFPGTVGRFRRELRDAAPDDFAVTRSPA